MNKLSIKLRVTLWYSLIMIIISSIVLVIMVSFNQMLLERDFETRIVKTVDENEKRISLLYNIPHSPKDIKYFDYGVHMALYSEDGEIIEGQIPFDAITDTEFSDRELRKLSIGNNQYYIYDRKIIQWNLNVIWLRGIISVTNESYMLRSFIKANLILSMVLIVIASFGGYLIIKRALIPVEKIRITAKEISEGEDLSKRISIGSGKDEVSRLANTFDDMLDKIEQTLEKEKQFTSDASHELRTPVAVITSECEYMLDCAQDTDDLKESAQVIKRQVDKMSKLISELLTMSRMDKNTQNINFEMVDISELLTIVCEEQTKIQTDSITLTADIPENIHAMADRFLIARLFINLISNAYKYGKENGHIWISLCEDKNDITFIIKDDGIGISEENLPKIWDRFYQVDPARTSNEKSGIGLGLSMVKWICNCHKGNITVKSELGVGSEFIFKMPKK